MKNSVVLYNPNETEDKASYLKEVVEGLSKPEKEIPFKFVYDDEGSRFITLINSTEVYYIWKCEKQIFTLHSSKMLEIMGQCRFNLIDLGAGDASKTQILLRKALEQKYDFEYIPMDISHDSNKGLLERFENQLPDLKMTALTSQFQEGITWVQNNRKQKNVYFFVGATIGNATRQENQTFVKFLGEKLKKGDQIFVGFDKMKNASVITRAYLDNGYEEKFLLNNLKRLNKQLGCDFDLSKFEGFPYFDPHSRCMEFIIISQEEQEVSIGDKKIEIGEAEVIKTGKSRKWLIKEAIQLFRIGEMQKVAIFEDEKHYYSYIVFQKK